MVEILNTLKERQKRTIARKLKKGEIDFDKERDCFIYVEGGEEFEIGGGDKDSGDDDFGDEEEKKDDSDY